MFDKPSGYMIDVSALFYRDVSQRAFSMVMDYIGGLERLIDLSCSLALDFTHHRSEERIIETLQENWQWGDDNSVNDTLVKVIISIARVLCFNFVMPLRESNATGVLIGIIVKDAKLLPYDYLTRQGIREIGSPSLYVVANAIWDLTAV